MAFGGLILILLYLLLLIIIRPEAPAALIVSVGTSIPTFAVRVVTEIFRQADHHAVSLASALVSGVEREISASWLIGSAEAPPATLPEPPHAVQLATPGGTSGMMTVLLLVL